MRAWSDVAERGGQVTIPERFETVAAAACWLAVILGAWVVVAFVWGQA